MSDKLSSDATSATAPVGGNETLVGTEALPKKVKKSAPVRGGAPLVDAK